MLKAINTKILIAILAAVTAIGALLVHQNQVNDRRAADAAKTRMILEQQQREADVARKNDEQMRKTVEANKKKHSSYDSNGSKMDSYIP